MNRPVIGVFPLVEAVTDRQWMKPTYISAIFEAGGLPLVLPLRSDAAALEAFVDACDGFLVTGGVDISPAEYGQQPLPECGEASTGLDAMEEALIPRILAADKPLLGICRGLQFLNVALGGTLWQDLPSQYSSEVPHRMEPPYERHVHRAIQEKDSPLLGIIPAKDFGVNSCHHQGICKLGRGLAASARSEDGLVEAVSMPEKKFVHAVQWHPEDLYSFDPNAAALFRALVEAAKP